VERLKNHKFYAAFPGSEADSGCESITKAWRTSVFSSESMTGAMNQSGQSLGAFRDQSSLTDRDSCAAPRRIQPLRHRVVVW